MSLKALSDYTVYSRYAHYLPGKKRRETWEEITDRVFAMHARKYAKVLVESEEFRKDFEFAKDMVKKKRVLGSQRALQFGGEWIEKHHLKIFNCATTHIDRARAFQEIMFTLLCGTGMGFSVQKQHISKLPNIARPSGKKKTYQISDSIEGWSDAIGVLMASYFFDARTEFSDYRGLTVEFDYSQIRPEGSLIAGQFKAPGHKGLETALEKIRALINRRIEQEFFKSGEFAGKLRPIDAYDVVMLSSDAVLSGGVRRSATICLFSPDDKEMMTAKTSNWFVENPQRARSNNSAALLKGHTTREQFASLMQSTRQFGEPGFIWLDNLDTVYNPCCEIGMIPTLDGESGVQVCNLVEINGKYCDTLDKFMECCRAAAIIGTMQAGYTDFKYLTPVSKWICDKEALLGCSITGIMDNPAILLDLTIQQAGAKLILDQNAKTAQTIGVNPTARATCVKPAGSTSCVLKTASGIHPHHAKRYIRRVQGNRNEFPLQFFKSINPEAVEPSVWSANGTDEVISFMCEVPKGAKLKNDISATDFLSQISLTQNNWVEYGTRPELCTDSKMRHNVSCTVVVRDNEWPAVEDYIFTHQKDFAGISLLSASGDLDYAQAPFATVLTPEEIVAEYGDGSIIAAGLIVDGLAAFNNDLWKACDTTLGFGDKIETLTEPVEPVKPSRREYKTEKSYTAAVTQYATKLNKFYVKMGEYRDNQVKADWVRRAKQFADRYFAGDLRKATYCLKHVSLWHTWLTLKRTYKDVDWSTVVEETESHVSVDTLAGGACAGGACEIR